MAGDLIRIVDSIAATPTVLFDLNDENPCGVTGFSAPPPQLVRSSVQTMQQDGATEAGSVYGDRTIEVDVDLYAMTQDASATSLQRLGRLLSDPRGQWLMYQPNGATSPVFFRTRRADISAIEDVLSSSSLRELDLSIPAEPFAYGLPVTGTAEIANNPTTTGGMSHTFPDVQGDVPSPLRLGPASPRPTNTRERVLLVSAAVPESITLPLPGVIDSAASTIGSVSTGWIVTDVSDSSCAGGSKRRLQRDSGVATQTAVSNASVSVPFGEYRVLVRAALSVPATLSLFPDGPSAAAAATTSMRWHDIGVTRLPRNSSEWDSVTGLTEHLTAITSLVVGMDQPGTADIDMVAFIPAGLDQALASKLMTVDFLYSPNAQTRWAVDGINEIVDHLYGTPAKVASRPPVAGGFPTITPGAKNLLFYASLDGPGANRDHSLTGSESFSYLYFPRYLYVRPATT